jgi:predicted amidohydrolase YtcJ
MKRTIAAFALVLSPALAPAQAQRATLALINGHVVTMDSTKPEAQAIAIAGDRIIAVGSNEEIQRTIGASTKVVNLAGRLATPGFADGHGHYMALGATKLQLDLTKAKTWEEIVAMVGAAARKAKPGDWIIGFGWHQAKWERPPVPVVEGNPVHATLSAVSPNNPV